MGVSYVPVAKAGEIGPGKTKAVELGGRRVLVAQVDGRYFAFARECPHEGADLETGELAGGKVRCNNHSYWYDLGTGECVMPKGGPQLAVLPVEERDGELCIRLEW